MGFRFLRHARSRAPAAGAHARHSRGGNGAVGWHGFLWASAILLLPNALFWWAAGYFGYQRAWLNLDYVLPLFLWALGWRWTGWAAMLLALAVDLLAGVAQVYVIFDPPQILQALAFLREARPGFLLAGFAVLCALLGIWAFTAHAVAAKGVGARALLAALAPWVLLNIAPMLAEADRQQANFHIDRRTVFLASQADYLHRMFYRSDIGNHLSHQENGETAFEPLGHPTAAETAWGNGRQLPGRMLLVVVESWGQPHDARLLQMQLRPLLQGAHIEVLQRGTVAFSGGTIMGELREVCSLAASRIYFKQVKPPPGHACWPQRLNAMGYATTSMNGGSALMYNASDWHASAGFANSYFMQDFPAGSRRCHSFPSLCDWDLSPFVAKTLAASDKAFFYWLSVNSHIPYDARDLRHGPSPDCKALNWADDSPACLHHSLIQEFMANVAGLLQAPELAGTEVVLAGDHAPPFLQAHDRERFDQKVVPYLHLRVRRR